MVISTTIELLLSLLWLFLLLRALFLIMINIVIVMVVIINFTPAIIVAITTMITYISIGHDV